ncbi:rRNA-processing protein fcf1 [Xylographa parallela]|nr:rRNA-processing protein fcf1 [Xylographa parallela]
MGIQKKTRKFAQVDILVLIDSGLRINLDQVKRVIGQRDARLKKNQAKGEIESKRKAKGDVVVREIPQVSSSLFFQYNTALVPPYSILVDTNFLSHTVQHKLELLETMMDCLYAKCIPIITDCVMAELEKLGQKYRIALRIARDERWERLKCDHKGVYADDCLVDRVMKHKVYIVATNDRDLKRRIRKIPGVPIMSVARGKYVIERLPDAPEK